MGSVYSRACRRLYALSKRFDAAPGLAGEFQNRGIRYDRR